jgi:hypothetical protein
MPITMKQINEGTDVTGDALKGPQETRGGSYATPGQPYSYATVLNAERCEGKEDILGNVLKDASKQAYGSYYPESRENRALELQLAAERAEAAK